MLLRHSLALTALAAMGLAAAHPAAAQSTIALQNGAFVGNSYSNNINSFQGSQSYYYAYGYHYQDANGGTGAYVNGGSIYQFLGTTGAAGETLTLNGYVGNDLDSSGNPLSPTSTKIEFTTAAPTATDTFAAGSVLAGETVIAPPAGTIPAIVPLTFTTSVANQGIYLIIGGPDVATYGQYGAQSNYQSFSLKDTLPAVPEASSSLSFGLLLLLGAGGFAAARKRKAAIV